MATRRYGTIIRHLRDDPDTARELCERLITAHQLEEFLTLSAYEHLDSIPA